MNRSFLSERCLSSFAYSGCVKSRKRVWEPLDKEKVATDIFRVRAIVQRVCLWLVWSLENTWYAKKDEEIEHGTASKKKKRDRGANGFIRSGERTYSDRLGVTSCCSNRESPSMWIPSRSRSFRRFLRLTFERERTILLLIKSRIRSNKNKMNYFIFILNQLENFLVYLQSLKLRKNFLNENVLAFIDFQSLVIIKTIFYHCTSLGTS